MKRYKNLIYFAAIPLVTIVGTVIFGNRIYAWLTLAVAVLSCVPFFIGFEKKEEDPRRLIIISVMISLSVVGRFIFAPIPGFKPVTAMTVITAMYFGKDAGFMSGALTAVISNFYFGQGPWTPFQTFGWGIIGFFAGLAAERLKKSKVLLSLYGAASGIVYSLLMDVWTVLWADGGFDIKKYAAIALSSLPTTVLYAVSNVIFLLILSDPVGKILKRIKIKSGI